MIDFLLAVPGKLTTIYSHLTTYLSSTRCAKIDNLDAAMSTRAAASTALSTATWTGTKAGYLDMAISGVARIKSIQQVTIAVPAGNASGSTTITSVDTAKSFILNNGFSTTDVSALNVAYWATRVSISAATTVTATRGTSSGSYPLTVGVTVVEFY